LIKIAEPRFAETLVAEAYEELWLAAGAELGWRTWTNKDVEDSIQMKSFSAETKVDLGFDPLAFFDETVMNYLTRLMPLRPGRSACCRWREVAFAPKGLSLWLRQASLYKAYFAGSDLNEANSRTSAIRCSRTST
jgi:hypothetical protein